ncbi:MAG: DNA repair protein RecN [Actinomycetota bacterium]|nr:DNA repair protein RecN [Actinomycetota bacterium]
MLTDLVVEDLGVIETADLELDRGCSALTGETGTGKTLVVAALGLLLGSRGERTLVRSDASEARVEGRFSVPPTHPAISILESHGLVEPSFDDDDESVEVVVIRTVPPVTPVKDSGRAGKCRVNGRIVTVAVLAELGATLVEIAGQHEYQRLGRPAQQRRLLDAFAGPEALDLAAEVSAAVRRAGEAARSYEALRAGEQRRARELDVLRFEIEELEGAAIEPGESAGLIAEADRLANAEAIALGLTGAIEAIRGEGGAEDLVTGARRAVEGLTAHSPSLGPLADRLDSAAYELEDVAAELALQVGAPDPALLESLRQRLVVLQRLERKYGADETGMLEYLRRARERRAELERAEGDIERWATERDEACAEAERLGAELSELRRMAAPALEEAMTERLAGLAMGGARFEVQLRPAELYEGGAEAVDFRIATGPGEAAKPVTKIASGGELSRISLALHLLTTTGPVTTMVFDEVDAGLGGEAAQHVGRSLAGLARDSGVQTIVVTHLPQVAAHADAHYRVTKAESGGRVVTVVAKVEGEERVAELSRMLAGLPKSAVARRHARELLELASP